MAIKIFTANLNGGDAITADNDLIFKIYGLADSYTTPIHTSGSHTSDADVTVTGDVVVIENVEVGAETDFKISAIDEASNESILSDAFSGTVVTYGIDIKYASLQSATIPFNPGTLNWKITINTKGAPNFINQNVVVGNQQSTTTVAGTFQVTEGASSSQLILKCNASGTAVISANVTIATDGDIIIERNAAVMSITSGGVTQTVDCTGYNHDNALDLRYGAFTVSASNQNVKMDSLIQEINAVVETFLPTSQSTGATITGDNATIMTLHGGSGTTSDMYFAL